MSEVRSCRRPGGQAGSREAAAGSSLASSRAAGCFQPGVRTRRRCPARGRAAGSAALHRRPREAGAGRQPPAAGARGGRKVARAGGCRSRAPRAVLTMLIGLCAARSALRRRGAAAAAMHRLGAAGPQPQQRHPVAPPPVRRSLPLDGRVRHVAALAGLTGVCAARTGGHITHYGLRGARAAQRFAAPALSERMAARPAVRGRRTAPALVRRRRGGAERLLGKKLRIIV